MIVKAPAQRFPTAPQGTFPAVCVDEIDLGKVENKRFGTVRNMVRLVWQIDEEMDAETAAKFKMRVGSRYVLTQDYTASLDEKAKLRKHLQSWRGRAFTQVELFGFDLETVVGAPCLLGVVHNTGSQGGTFANVEAVMKLPKGTPALKPEGYIRVKDRQEAQPKAALEPTPETQYDQRQHAPETGPPDWDLGITDEDVPFKWRPQRRGRAGKTMLQMQDRQAA